MSKVWDKEWLQEAVDNADSFAEIAEQVDCGPNAVARWVKRHNIDFDGDASNSLPDDVRAKLKDEEWLRSEYHSKKTLDEITSELGIVTHTLYRYLDKHNINRVGVGNNMKKGPEHPMWEGGGGTYYGPNWDEQRKKAIQRDSNECVVCGIAEAAHLRQFNNGLHVHHVIPLSDFEGADGKINFESANKLDNLATLCLRCHARWEGVYLMPERC